MRRLVEEKFDLFDLFDLFNRNLFLCVRILFQCSLEEGHTLLSHAPQQAVDCFYR